MIPPLKNTFRARVANYALGAYKVYIERVII